MSSGDEAPRDFYDRMSVRHIVILFGICVAIVIILAICRIIVNIIVIDVFILRDCSAWKKIFCCFMYCDNSDGDNDEENRGNNVPDRRSGLRTAGALSNPVSYIYNVSKERRDIFLSSIKDTELLNKVIIDEMSCVDNDKDEEVETCPNEDAIDNKTSNDNLSDKEALNICSICLHEQEINEYCSEIRSCSHTFHHACISSWIERSLICPVCRKQMITNERLLECIASKRYIFTQQ